jgi:hypothetical protein
VFLPPDSKIEQSVESGSKGCDEHQDEHKDLYWFTHQSVIPYV